MSAEDLNSYADPQGTGSPDAVEDDPAALNSAEDLDEDRLRKDPLEAGMDPPEHWSGVTKYGMTPWEESHPRPLDQRLAEEQPDVEPGAPAPEPVDRGEPSDLGDPSEPGEDVASFDADAISQDEPELVRTDQPEELVRADPDTLSREEEIRAEAVGRGQAADDY
ncbi:hypothetical protein ACFXGA_39015 [Actinosynnema sp. NPDC059335]|uniref:hypothetical protein n=1 Tax=Actinosynnema sp. NPDC059335 TaxID=3346804 RepID=UPI00366EF7A9